MPKPPRAHAAMPPARMNGICASRSAEAAFFSVGRNSSAVCSSFGIARGFPRPLRYKTVRTW